MRKSLGTLPTKLPPQGKREIDEYFCSAIPNFSDKTLGHWADATPDTIANWRALRSGPRFANAIRVARKVPKLKAAIIELLDMGDAAGPSPFRLIAILFDALLEIAKCEDEIAAARARKALMEFAREKTEPFEVTA